MAGLHTIERLTGFKDSIIDPLIDRRGSVRVDEDLSHEFEETFERTKNERAVFRLVPYRDKESSGIDGSLELIRGLYQIGGHFSFELWHGDGTEFIVTVERGLAERFQEVASVFFKNMHVISIDDCLPPIGNDDHIAGASVALTNDQFLQIKNFRGVTQMDRDPYEDVVASMEGLPDDVRIVIQTVFVPAEEGWTSRIYTPIGSPIYDRLLDLGNGVPFRPEEYSTEELGNIVDDRPLVAEYLEEQAGDRAFVTAIRVIAIANTAETAQTSVDRIARTFVEGYHDEAMEQGLKYRAIGQLRLKKFLRQATERTFSTRRELVGKYKRKPMVLTIPELASVAHIPTTVEHDRFHFDAPSIEWAETGAIEESSGGEDHAPDPLSDVRED